MMKNERPLTVRKVRRSELWYAVDRRYPLFSIVACTRATRDVEQGKAKHEMWGKLSHPRKEKAWGH
eukprot:2337608-Rhodomonas_salina.1